MAMILFCALFGVGLATKAHGGLPIIPSPLVAPEDPNRGIVKEYDDKLRVKANQFCRSMKTGLDSQEILRFHDEMESSDIMWFQWHCEVFAKHWRPFFESLQVFMHKNVIDDEMWSRIKEDAQYCDIFAKPERSLPAGNPRTWGGLQNWLNSFNEADYWERMRLGVLLRYWMDIVCGADSRRLDEPLVLPSFPPFPGRFDEGKLSNTASEVHALTIAR